VADLTGENLVAKPEAIDWYTGLGPADSTMTLFKDIGDHQDWEAFAVDGLAIGLDALAFVMNPLGELVKAGVGWLMEHLDFIREPLEVLTGDPKAITAIAKTWENISKELAESATDYTTAMTDTEGWKGESAGKYRAVAKEYIEALTGIGKQAHEAGVGVKTAGIVVATERAIIFDIIATFISDVITRALLALASSWFTLGGSIAVFVGSVIADAVQLIAKIQKRVGKLLGAIQRFVSKYNALGSKSADAAKVLGRKSSELGREANKAIKQTGKTLDSLAPSAGKLKTYANYIEGEGTSAIAKRMGPGSNFGEKVSSDGVRLAKETAKATKDAFFMKDPTENKGQ
jgi:hypothetical protein